MRVARTKKGIERQLKRDHIAKIQGDILDMAEWHFEYDEKGNLTCVGTLNLGR
jgi:hypothetical protein